MRLIACLCLMFMLSLPAGAAAQDGGISLDQAVRRVKEQQDVRVLSAERVRSDGKLMYRIKVLTREGRVRHVWVDPGG